MRHITRGELLHGFQQLACRPGLATRIRTSFCCLLAGLTLQLLTVETWSSTLTVAIVANSARCGQLRAMQTRRTADHLLKKARQAISEGNLELAEWYTARAEQLDVNYDSVFQRFVDTPEKVRQAIALQRGKQRPVANAPANHTASAVASAPRPAAGTNGTLLPSQAASHDSAASATRDAAKAVAGQPAQVDLPSAKAKASDFLEKGRTAIAEGNLVAAVGWYHSANAVGADFEDTEFSPADLAEELQSHGIDAQRLLPENPTPPISDALLDPARSSITGNPRDAVAAPANAATGNHRITSASLLERGELIRSNVGGPGLDPELQVLKDQTLRLLAESQAALDRGDLQLAEDLARAAQDLKLPDKAYDTGDLRPWMLLLEIGKRYRRHGTSALTDLATSRSTFQPPPMPKAASQIELSAYDPLQDHTRTQAIGVQTTIPTATSPNTTITQTAGSQSAIASTTSPRVANPQIADPPTGLPSQIQSFPPESNSLPAVPTPAAEPVAAPTGRSPMPAAGMRPVETQRVATRPPVKSSPNTGESAVADTWAPSHIPPQPLRTESPPAAQAPSFEISDSLPDDLFPSVPPAQVPAAVLPSAASPDPPAAADKVESAPRATPAGGPSMVELPTGQSLAVESESKSPLQNSPAEKRMTPAAEESREARKLFANGESALKNGELKRARELFKQAWKSEGTLDPETRQRLQDHLQMLAQNDRQIRGTEPIVPAALPAAEREKVQQLLREVSRQLAAIRAQRENDPIQAWEQIKQLGGTVTEADVDEAARSKLAARVENAAADLENYIEQNRPRIENDQRNKRILDEIDRSREQRRRNEQQLAEMVEQFNELMDQQRFPEAVIVAKKAREVAPHNPVVQNMVWKGQVARQMMTNMVRSQRFQEGALYSWDDISESSVPITGNLEFPDLRTWDQLTKDRKKWLQDNQSRYSAAELDIHRALKKQVDVQFENASLAEVLYTLGKMTGVNVYLDPEGLAAEAVTTDTTVNLKLPKPISLQSALNLILEPLHLGYVIQNEVLRITSEQVRQGDVVTRTYNVADLVIPIPNFVPGYEMGLPGALREAYNMISRGYGAGGYVQAPLTMMNDPGAAHNPNSNASVLAQMGTAGLVPGMPRSGVQPQFGPAGTGGGTQADFATLIDLIQTTVEPDSWEDVGGTGTIAGFPTNLSLVVSQTQDVHEKIVDLLQQLRRLQDLQVTIEVRFITLQDDFFERIGVDFDFNIDDNTGLTVTDIEARQFEDDGPSVTIGLDPTGRPTLDLDVQYRNGSFASAVPQFGGFDTNTAATLGFAILSDIEAFFVIQAAQGDTRTNVLQAPKVTLFNGQQAFVSDQAQQPFVTSVIPVVGDFAAAHQPVITVLTEGTSLSVQAVVSNDRRFVRLTLVPFFSRIGKVDEFTFEGATDTDTGTNVVDPSDEENTVRDNARRATVGTTVQLPTFAFTSVTTTVSVPDGGTILLGGIKRLSEGRNERGVPVFSKLPYVNRLFKNVGIGRESTSLMMMVTPRIIIQEEEEEKLGLTSTGGYD